MIISIWYKWINQKSLSTRKIKKFKLTVRNTYFLKDYVAIKNFLKFCDLRIPVIKSTTSEQDTMNSTLKIPFPSIYYITVSNGHCCIIDHKDLFLLFYKILWFFNILRSSFHLSLSSCLLSIDLMISRILHFITNGRMTCENKEIKSIFFILWDNNTKKHISLKFVPLFMSSHLYFLVFVIH